MNVMLLELLSGHYRMINVIKFVILLHYFVVRSCKNGLMMYI